MRQVSHVVHDILMNAYIAGENNQASNLAEIAAGVPCDAKAMTVWQGMAKASQSRQEMGVSSNRDK